MTTPQEKERWVIHERVKNNLLKIREKLRQDYDYILVISGREGSGKSTLAAHCAYIVDPTINADRFCFDGDEFLNQLTTANKYQAIIFDEAGTNLYSREAMTNMNRLITKALMLIRQKNLMLILCIPSFFVLDTYVRNHRVNALINIHKRGHFRVWNSKGAKLVSVLGAKTMEYKVKTPIRGMWSKYWPSEELHKAYLKKKVSHLNTYMKSIKGVKDGYVKLSEAEKITGYGKTALRNWVKDGTLEGKQIGRLFFVKSKSLTALKKKKIE